MITDKSYTEWKFDGQNTWLIGSSDDGAGVFAEGNLWTGNVVCGHLIESIGNYSDIEIAKAIAFVRWLEKRKVLGFEGITF